MVPPHLSKWFWITVTTPFVVAGAFGGWWWWGAALWAVFNVGWAGGIYAALHTLRPHAKTLHGTTDCYCGPMADWGSCAYCAACRAFGLRAPSSYYPNPDEGSDVIKGIDNIRKHLGVEERDDGDSATRG